MLPGPDLIYKCPNCENLLKRGSLTSGNTFGATQYSDGKRIAPMLPDFPNLTKCKKCEAIFWLNDLEKIGGYSKWQRTSEEYKTEEMRVNWENAENAEFLGVKDLFKSLKTDKGKLNEKTIRTWIWWAFNDRIREDDGRELVFENNEMELWQANCNSLIKLLNKDDQNEKFMIAELFRNLGEFEKCIEILDDIDGRGFYWIKDPMKYLAQKAYKFVFKLQPLSTNSKYPFFQERGQLRDKRGDYQGALDDYDKAIGLDENNPFLYVLKAGIYEKLSKLELVLKSFDKALSINLDCSDAYINRALFYRRQKQFELSQKDYDKALSLEPRSYNIVGFNEEDIFKYGVFDDVVSESESGLFRKGTLYIEIYLSPYKKSEVDTALFINAQMLPYFIFRNKKKRQKPILSKRFVSFEFFVAKRIFYIRVYVFGKKIRFIDKAVLN